MAQSAFPPTLGDTFGEEAEFCHKLREIFKKKILQKIGAAFKNYELHPRDRYALKILWQNSTQSTHFHGTRIQGLGYEALLPVSDSLQPYGFSFRFFFFTTPVLTLLSSSLSPSLFVQCRKCRGWTSKDLGARIAERDPAQSTEKEERTATNKDKGVGKKKRMRDIPTHTYTKARFTKGGHTGLRT